MDYFDDIQFEKEKAKLLDKYGCNNLDEVIAILKYQLAEKKLQENFETLWKLAKQ